MLSAPILGWITENENKLLGASLPHNPQTLHLKSFPSSQDPWYLLGPEAAPQENTCCSSDSQARPPPEAPRAFRGAASRMDSPTVASGRTPGRVHISTPFDWTLTSNDCIFPQPFGDRVQFSAW